MDTGSIPDIPYGSLSIPGALSEHRAKYNLWVPPGVTPSNKIIGFILMMQYLLCLCSIDPHIGMIIFVYDIVYLIVKLTLSTCFLEKQVLFSSFLFGGDRHTLLRPYYLLCAQGSFLLVLRTIRSAREQIQFAAHKANDILIVLSFHTKKPSFFQNIIVGWQCIQTPRTLVKMYKFIFIVLVTSNKIII